MEVALSSCLDSFVEEFDTYLNHRGDPKDDDFVAEMEDFMNRHLPASVRRNLKKLEEED